jgi:uncharacterized membrane protein YcaP (DUF421 family)
MLQDMFHIPIPILEKILRPILVYLALIILIRCFGKRELAQLNPFDLVVLLSLSNTVQNAIIGDDNSLSGGIIGAFTLLAINWLVVRMLYSSPRMNRLLGGVERTLIEDGRVDNYALKKELLSQEDLLTVVHRQGFEPSTRSRAVYLSRTGHSISRLANHLRTRTGKGFSSISWKS